MKSPPRSLKLFAALLGYPTQELVAAVPEIARRINEERLLSDATHGMLAALLRGLASEDLLDLQERYVAQFDTGRATCLNLFEHVHGDSRDRGQAMIDLHALYGRAGVKLVGNELPDYLPAVLEFLSSRPADEAREMLSDCAHIVRAIGERLLAASSPYAGIFRAILELIGEEPLRAGAAECAVQHPDDDWAEAPADFGMNAAHGAQQSRPQFIRFVSRPEPTPGAPHGPR